MRKRFAKNVVKCFWRESISSCARSAERKGRAKVEKRVQGEKSMSEIKLKPCPFCGGEASIKSVTKGTFVKKVGYFAVCNSCGASTHVALNINDVPHKWNRRADNER